MDRVTSELKDLTLYKENNEYYLKAIYEQTNEIETVIVEIPKIHLPLRAEFTIESYGSRYTFYINYDVDLGFGKLKACMNKDGDVMTYQVKEKEMTIDEIEKKLGYKIKIVNDK